MANILHIETSAKRCSVAVSADHALLAAEGITTDGYVHAEMLHMLVADALRNSALSMTDLHAVAVSKGPGSYTGLRIGVSAAKGFCYALDIPLLSVDTTAVIALHAGRNFPDAQRIVSMIDARRMEVYCGVFDQSFERVQPDHAVIVDENFARSFDPLRTVFAGDGASKVSHFGDANLMVHSFLPSAEMMIEPALHKFHAAQFENNLTFEPYYLKDYLPGITKKTLV
jgi:tRNA threonylcarbamoyladenosine biosynthesis protein TsaB